MAVQSGILQIALQGDERRASEDVKIPSVFDALVVFWSLILTADLYLLFSPFWTVGQPKQTLPLRTNTLPT
jgi:hypothetical protein